MHELWKLVSILPAFKYDFTSPELFKVKENSLLFKKENIEVGRLPWQLSGREMEKGHAFKVSFRIEIETATPETHSREWKWDSVRRKVPPKPPATGRVAFYDPTHLYCENFSFSHNLFIRWCRSNAFLRKRSFLCGLDKVSLLLKTLPTVVTIRGGSRSIVKIHEDMLCLLCSPLCLPWQAQYLVLVRFL